MWEYLGENDWNFQSTKEKKKVKRAEAGRKIELKEKGHSVFECWMEDRRQLKTKV